MESRSTILAAVRANKPGEVALPSIRAIERNEISNCTDTFKNLVQAIGGKVEEIQYNEVQETVERLFPDAKYTASGTKRYKGTIQLEHITDPKALENLDVFVCRGLLGVAENGAVWIPESAIVHRVAPFITQHMVVVLNESTILEDMHAAYDEIDVAEYGFGFFMAGPSKTADIEQSLVHGAHGPRSLTVLLLKTL